MHGFIVTEIKKYVVAKLGASHWLQILQTAELGSRDYVNFEQYPDAEVVQLVGAASRLTGTPVSDLLFDFGRFLGADLTRIYRPVIDPAWRTLDFLANTESTIHRVVRTRNRQAAPPALKIARTAPDQVTITYNSPRRMCDLGKGIVAGVASGYGEQVEVQEDACMHAGAPACILRVRLVQGAASR
jgi:hypothetical protein